MANLAICQFVCGEADKWSSMTASSEKKEPCVLCTVWSAHDGRRDTGYGTTRCGRPLAAVPADARGMRLLFRLEDSMKYGYRRESRIRGCRIRHQLDPRSCVSHIGANRLRIDGFCLRKGRGAWFHPVIDADSMICVSNNRRTRRGRPVGIGPRQDTRKSESQIPQQDKTPASTF